ncbi:MAG: hypothetical protein ACP5KY_08175 [Thermoproteus sp.]
MNRIFFLLLSILVNVSPVLLYRPIVAVSPDPGFRIGVSLMALGAALYLLLQISYYACALPKRYVAASLLVPVLIYLMTVPGLSLIGIAALVLMFGVALHMGIKLGVFEDWFEALVWLIVWNLFTGLIGLGVAALAPHNLLMPQSGIWLWSSEPPATPAKVLTLSASGAVSTYIVGRLWRSLNRCGA